MPQPATTSQRRWFQFSLRTLLILVALVAAVAFGYVKLVEPYRLQREAMAAITRLGGSYKTEEAAGWIKYLDKNAQDVVVVDLADCDKPDEYLPHLVRLPRLRTLVVGGHSVGDEQVAALGRVGSLRGLVLDSTLVSDEGVDGLKSELPALIVYKSKRIARTALTRVGGRLGEVDLHDYSQRDHAQQELRPPDWLRTETGDSYFAEWSPIMIGLDGTQVTDADLRWLANLTEARAIYAMGTNVTGSFLRDVGAVNALERLYLDETKLTDANCAYVSRFPNLTWLDLEKTGISDEGLAPVASLSQLEVLRFDDTRITDAGLVHVVTLSRLQSVIGPRTLIGDRGLALLSDLPSLELLHIPNTLVTDEGLVHLQRSSTLRRLSLNGTKITDAGVAHLQKCTRLTLLEIERTRISSEGVNKLRTALPHCEIEYVRPPARRPSSGRSG